MTLNISIWYRVVLFGVAKISSDFHWFQAKTLLCALKCWVRDLHNWFRSGFSDFRGCLWRGYARHRGSCVMPLAWVGHEIWYKNKNRTLFRKNFFFDENFIFEEIWKSKILKKKVIFRRKNITFFHWFFIEKSDFFEEKFQIFFLREKYFLSNFLFRKNPLTIFWKRIFGRDFFLTYALCDFLSIEHVFEWIPPFRKSVGRYLLRGANSRLPPPLVEISDSGL